MPNPRGLALLSTHLEKLLGREYRSLAARYHGLLNEEGYPALEKDAHRAHVAVLRGLVRREDTPSLILETLNPVLRDCLPVYHVHYEKDRETSIRLALEKIKASILKVRGSHWSRRDLALEVLEQIQQGYEWALAHDVANIQTRVGVAILEQGYYSLDVKTARRLLCIDARGGEFRENRSGAHAVCAANGIHYKPSPTAAIGVVGKDISEIEPAWEYLAVSLMQSIAGNQLAAAPTGLWSIQDVPLERADALKSTSGIVQAGLSIQESMCFREFLFLREAIRFFKRTMGEEALIHLLENQQQGYSHFLALAQEHFPQTFIYPEASTEEEHVARSRAFQESFQSLAQGKAIEDCFEEMQNRINRFDVSEARRVLIFRELYEKHKANLDFLQVLLVLTRQYPTLMDGQSIATSLRLLKSLPSLWTLFPKETTRDAIARIEWVLSDYLDKEAASTLWVGLLFTLPKDAKSDNFRLQLFYDANKRLERCRIVSIDNDLSFSMPFVPVRGVENSESETPELGLTIKNILYFLPELLEQSIDPEACARLLSQSAQSQWLAWLCLAARRNEEHAAWAAQGILSFEEAARLQIRLPKQTLEFILGQWERLQVLLKANPQMSHGALLEALYPAVAATYHETVVREVNAYKKYPTVIDYERLVHDECCDRGCYKIAFHPEDATPDKEAEICLYYYSAKSQAAPTFEPLPETEVELSEFVLTLLRRQNWSQLDKAEHWPLVEAFSLLSRAERQDWEENVPSEERQGLWQFWLKEAIRRGAPFVAARLLDLGASAALPMGEDFKMPLHYFCEEYLHYANLDEAQTMVDILLSHHSAQPNAYDTLGRTPLLQWANVRRQELLSAEHTATAEKVLGALCLQGADINLTDGHTSGSVLDKMVKRNNPQGFILAVAYGAKECRDMAVALEWCHTHLEVQGMQSALRRLRQQSLTWAWWLGLPEWQHREGGRPVQGVVSGVFSLPQPLWKVWEQAALDLPEAPIESVRARKEKYGRRKVRAIEYGETRVHLKPRPEMPAMEFAVAALLNTLFGDLVAPSDCLGVMDDRKKMHSVLLSQTVAGEPLIDALDSPEKQESFEARLDKRQTSAQIIGAMLIHPEDGSPANYLVSPKFAANGEEANLIVAVDTDHAFVEAMGEDGSLQVKSILFCLKAMMAPVHPVWRDRIVGLAVKPFLSNWFKEVEYYQNQSHHIFNQRARIALQDVGFGNRMAGFLGSKKAALPVVMTFPLHEAAIIAVHDRFMQLQSILREKPTITHLALLKHLNPALGKRYQEAFEINPAPNQIMKRFYDLCGKSYGKKGQTLSTTEAVLKAMRLPKAQEKAIVKQDEKELFTPAKALKTLERISREYENKRVILNELYERGYSEAFIHLESKTLQMQIVSELDWRHRQFINANKGKGDKKEKEKEAEDEYWNIEKQQRVLSCFIQAKISFRRLAIAHCAAFTERHLEALLAYSRDIAYIKLIDCPNLGNGVFEVIEKYNNILIALTLVQCHNLTETAWGLFEPTFRDLESLRIEDNLALTRISLKAPKLKRCHLGKNLALASLNLNGEELVKRDENGRTPLLQAAMKGDIAKFDRLLSSYPGVVSLQEKDIYGYTALFLSLDRTVFNILSGRETEMLAHLLLKYRDDFSLEEKSNLGTTVFLLAAAVGWVEAFKLLLAHYSGDAFKHRDNSGRNMLFYTVLVEKIDMFDYLASSISVLEKDNNGATVLLYAISLGKINFVKHLLTYYSEYFSVSEKDSDGMTILLYCAWKGQIDILEYFLKHYPQQVSLLERDLHGRAALSYAAMGDQIEMLEHLLKNHSEQVSLSERDINGCGVLLHAVVRGRVKMLEHLLRNHSGPVSLLERDLHGRAALSYAAMGDQIEMLEHLLKNHSEQVSLSERDNYGKTILLSAVFVGKLLMVKHLLLKYPDKFSLLERNSYNWTALHCAAYNGQIEMFNYLLLVFLDKNFLKEKDNRGKTVLLLAAQNGQIAMVDYLLSHYGDYVSLMEKDYKGRTVLMLATEKGQEKMRSHLLAKYPRFFVYEPQHTVDTIDFTNGKRHQPLEWATIISTLHQQHNATKINWVRKDENELLWKAHKGEFYQPESINFNSLNAVTLTGHSQDILALIQLQDGRLVSGSEDRSIIIWELQSKTPMFTLKKHTDRVSALTQLHDGRLVSGSWDGTIIFWDIYSGQPIRNFNTVEGRKYPELCRVTALKQLQDGKLASSNQSSILIWDIHTGQTLFCSTYSGYAITQLQDGRVPLCEYGWIALQTLPELLPAPFKLEQPTSHDGEVHALTQLQDGKLVVSRASGIDFWNTYSKRRIYWQFYFPYHRFPPSSFIPRALLQLKDGRLAIASYRYGYILLWDIYNVGRYTLIIKPDPDSSIISSLIQLQDNRIANSFGHSIMIWDIPGPTVPIANVQHTTLDLSFRPLLATYFNLQQEEQKVCLTLRPSVEETKDIMDTLQSLESFISGLVFNVHGINVYFYFQLYRAKDGNFSFHIICQNTELATNIYTSLDALFYPKNRISDDKVTISHESTTSIEPSQSAPSASGSSVMPTFKSPEHSSISSSSFFSVTKENPDELFTDSKNIDLPGLSDLGTRLVDTNDSLSTTETILADEQESITTDSQDILLQKDTFTPRLSSLPLTFHAQSSSPLSASGSPSDLSSVSKKAEEQENIRLGH